MTNEKSQPITMDEMNELALNKEKLSNNFSIKTEFKPKNMSVVTTQ